MPVELACPPSEDLSAYLLGRLPHAGMASVAEHVESCSRCQTAIETFDESPDPLLVGLRRLADVGMAAIGPVDSVQLAQAVALLGPLDEGFPAAPAGDLVPERVAAYRLGERLGQGGMGAVYRATHVSLGKTVAIKLLARERMADRGAQARFHREIRAVGQLRHANIVGATDAGEADGWHYLVMEHIDGWDLSRLVRMLGPLPIADACEIVRQGALALQHVQDHRLVHRDVKPSNLMLTRDGGVKLLDLGLAALLRDELRGPADAERDLTHAQQILGTLEYVAPEQLRDSRTVDVRADLYGLGGTLFKLLAGQSPFQARGAEVSPLQLAAHHLQTPAPDVRTLRPEVPAELAALVARLLAKRPEARGASPRELADQLAPLAKRADLAELATRAGVAVSSVAGAPETSRTSTFVHLPSAMSETDTRPKPPQLALSPVVQPVEPTKVDRRAPRIAALVALGVLSVAVLATVILYVRNTRIEIPDGSEVTVAPDGTVHVTPLENEEPNNDNPKPPVPARTPPLKKFDRTQPGQPLSRIALVARPAEVKGVASWSVETVGHRGDVQALAISPNEKWLASAGNDGAVRIW